MSTDIEGARTEVATSKWVSGIYAPVAGEVTAVDLPVRGRLPLSQPLGALDTRQRRARGAAGARGSPRRHGRRQHERDRARRATYAIVEAGARPVELTAELETITHSDFDGTLPHGYTAHPKVDPATGDLHAIAYHWALPYLEYVVTGADGRVRSVEPIDVADAPMVHDCSVTERWMVVYDLPVTFSLDAAASGASFPYRWAEGRPARVGLLPLGGAGADVRWFDVEPCYVFHPLNAFDDGERVVLDVVRYSRMFDASRLGPDESKPLLWRWTLDTVTGTLHEEQLADAWVEFPRVDERVVGRPDRWGYASSIRGGASNEFGGDLVRVDTTTGATERVSVGDGHLAGEWVMVPRDDGAAEDDGWLMSLVHDQAADRSELVVLDAGNPAAGPIAAVELPQRVPMGFHGNWVPDA